MFTGGVIWNTNRNLAVRLNRIECFSVEKTTDTATLIAHYVSSKGNLEELSIEKWSRQQDEELDQFHNRTEEQFRETLGRLVKAQMEEDLQLRGHTTKDLMSVFSNSVDWTKSPV